MVREFDVNESAFAALSVVAASVFAMALARLASTALDCTNPAELASFWAELVGGEVAYSSDDFCAVKTDRGWLAAVRIPDHAPPDWPDTQVPKQMHLDLAVDDLNAAEAEAIRLGASKPGTQPAPDRWRVLIDPAGHPFCLSLFIPE